MTLWYKLKASRYPAPEEQNIYRETTKKGYRSRGAEYFFMANTYTQIYIHIVFSTEQRQYLITEKTKDEIEKYISGIIQNKKQKLIAINCMPDHIHILTGIKPNISISDLVRDIKHHSSKFINSKGWFPGQFRWQEGFGAFSYSHSQLDNVITYIQNQKEHHKKTDFKSEYMSLLKKFNVEYIEKYVFDKS